MGLFTILLPAVLFTYLLVFRPSFIELVVISGLVFVTSAMYLLHMKNSFVLQGFVDGFLIGKRNRGKKKDPKKSVEYKTFLP
jgi:hypothetical protein